jgi:hypothetical protein
LVRGEQFLGSGVLRRYSVEEIMDASASLSVISILPDRRRDGLTVKLPRQHEKTFLCPDRTRWGDFLFHQLDQTDAAIRLPLGGKCLPGTEESFAGQATVFVGD